MPQPSPRASLVPSASTAALIGFIVSGLLLALPGAMLLAWDYHLRSNYTAIANYFIALNTGLLLAAPCADWIINRRGIGTAARGGCLVGILALVELAFTAPPVAEWWRLPGLLGIGFAASLVNSAVFNAISAAYRMAPAATVNLAGLFFSCGSLLSTLTVVGALGAVPVFWIPILLAITPAAGLILFARRSFPQELARRQRRAAEVVREMSLPGALLLALLLFFQFGNEWSIAGWLPIFLSERLGTSPSRALWLLSFYWISLATGRLAAQAILTRVGHGKLLFASAAAALMGCLVLAFTNNIFGAVLGIAFVGLGFAPIYPLAVERIGSRFTYYHPGLFNGIFSIGLTGGMLAPALVGYASELFGVRALIAVPAAGTVIVFLLVVLIWVDARWGTRPT